MDILITVLLYILAASLGFVLAFSILMIIGKKRSYSGTIKVIPSEGKLIYSLELDEDPVILQDMREVVFKVETSEESS